jgi:importin-4
MAAHTGAAFCPHLEAVMQVLQKAATNWHPLIKSEVADALPNLVNPSIAAYHNGEIQWTKGDTSSASPMSQHTTAIVSAVLTELIALLKDDDKTTVAKACEGVQSVIELCGPHALMPVAQSCMECSHDLLTKNAPCQVSDEFYEDAPEEDDDHDIVTQAACDLVGGFCRVMGAQFSQYLPTYLPVVCEYAISSRPPRDRSMAIGWLSEVAQEMEGAIFEHWQGVFLPAVMAGLSDPSEDVRRNAAFCAGVCCEHLREQVVDAYPQILSGLEPLFALDPASSDSAAACMDNVAACVARMMMACPNNLPMSQVLPAFLKLLPLKTDMTENETVYTCLLGLLQMNHPDAVAQRVEIKRIFSEALSNESKVDEEIKEKLKQALPVLQ